jgi:hypothetical protein
MSFSLRTGLSAIVEPKPNQSIRPIPSKLASRPGKSLKQMIETMLLVPHPEKWVQANEGFHDEHWSEEVQGVTWDGGHFYFSANDAGKPGAHPRAIYRFLGDGDVETVLEMDDQYGDHLGALDYFGGRFFCAMEGPVGVLVVDAASAAAARHELKDENGDPSKQASMPWCAVNPWNRLLYTSENGDDQPAITVNAYDPANDFRMVSAAAIDLTPHPAHHVQGGCFSPHGHLYLATDQRDPNDPQYKLIRVYSAFNGGFLGAATVLALEDNQELEDVCYAAVTLGGAAVQIHAVLLENIDTLDSDNIFFKHFAAPTPGAV